MANEEINIIPKGLLDRIWNRLAVEVDTDSCSQQEATAAIDDVCLMLHEADPNRFPWEEGEGDGEDDEEGACS